MDTDDLIVVAQYDINDSITHMFTVDGKVSEAASQAEQQAASARDGATVCWHSVTPARMDGRVTLAGRYLGGVLIIARSAMGARRPAELIPLIGTSF
jgi:hypothetical protein